MDAVAAEKHHAKALTYVEKGSQQNRSYQPGGNFGKEDGNESFSTSYRRKAILPYSVLGSLALTAKVQCVSENVSLCIWLVTI